MNGIDKNYDLNFDRGMFKLLQDTYYIKEVCDNLVALSGKIYGIPDYRYCRIMLYNSCIAPWCGSLPQLRTDVSVITRDAWTRTYLDAYQCGIQYLDKLFVKKGWKK